MTLTTHAIVGAAAAQIFPKNPILAFFAGFLSHLAIDSIHHWDYSLKSFRENRDDPLQNDMIIGKDLLHDFIKTGSDAFFGLAISVVTFTKFNNSSFITAAVGSIGGIFPDFLQFVYFKTRSKILLPLQKFHIWIQEGKTLKVGPAVGISLQIILIFAIFIIIKKII